MRFRKLGKTELMVSEIGLGTSKGLVEKASKREGEKLVRRAIDLGVNFIDTARHYGGGEAESRVGEAARGIREDLYICSKVGTLAGGGRSFALAAIETSVEDSLRKLKTDYLDCLLLHMASPAELSDQCAAVQVLAGLKLAGKTRFIGASVDGEWIWQGLEVEAFDVLEITYNIADLYPAESGFFKKATEKDMGLIIKEPLAVANFYRSSPSPPWAAMLFNRLGHYDFLKDESNLSAVEIALRFVLSAEQIHTAIPATSNIKHLEFNLSLSDGKHLPASIMEQIHTCYQKAVKTEG